MRILCLTITAAAVLTFTACGGGSEPSEPTEDGLRATLTAYAKEIKAGDAAGMFRYISKGYAEKCPFDEFSGRVLLGIAFIGEDFKDAEFRIDDVSVENGRGNVEADFYLDDKPLGFHDEDDQNYWAWEDGYWRLATDEAEPCG